MLNPILSPLLATKKHGFFTRIGGVSTGIYEGTNCGRGSSDNAEHVLQNRKLVAEYMGVNEPDLQSVHQYHSPDPITVETATKTSPKADAMVSANPDIALGILTADCAPVLFSDANENVVGAAHSGWKGALGGVLENTVQAMVDLGAKRENITAVIGPTISQKNYEVGQEFFEDFLDQDPDNARFFAQGMHADKYQFDLPSLCLSKLRNAGVNAQWSGHCTYADPERFYSYRRTTHKGEADYGRLISCIRA